MPRTRIEPFMLTVFIAKRSPGDVYEGLKVAYNELMGRQRTHLPTSYSKNINYGSHFQIKWVKWGVLLYNVASSPLLCQPPLLFMDFWKFMEEYSWRKNQKSSGPTFSLSDETQRASLLAQKTHSWLHVSFYRIDWNIFIPFQFFSQKFLEEVCKI